VLCKQQGKENVSRLQPLNIVLKRSKKFELNAHVFKEQTPTPFI